MQNQKIILLSTGGSGGHVFPAVSIALSLNSYFKVFIITDQKVLKYLKYKKYFFFRKSLLVNNIFLFYLFDILIFLLNFFFSKINYIVIFGSYASTIVFLFSFFLNLSFYIHEQNIFFGQVNFFFSFFSKNVFFSFPQKKYFKEKLIFGLPVILKNFFFSGKKVSNNLKIFIVGGSQGALIFNQIIPNSIKTINKIFINKIQLTQQIQHNYIEKIITSYSGIEYLYSLQTFCKNVFQLYTIHDIIMSRAGASTIIELILSKKFSVLVPYFYSKDNHQFFNAKFIMKNSKILIKEEQYFSSEWISSLIFKFIVNYEELLSLRETNLSKFRRLNFYSIFKFIKTIIF